MLNKLALALAVLIVVVLAAVAAIAISSIDDEVADQSESEEDKSPQPVPERTTVAMGNGSQPLAISCDVPADESTPLLVSFVNDTATSADYVAKITVVYTNGRIDTAIATAAALRAGERRSVIPEPWPDDGTVQSCRLDAVQQGEHLVLLTPDS